MSYFGITVEKIATAQHHSNADRLDICTLEGMSIQFVTGRDEYRPGDRVLYFPVDSVLPLELQRNMGVEGYLAGKNKDRVKTVRLRGEISQGLVGPQSMAAAVAAVSEDVVKTKEEWGVEIAEWLGVTKYEPAPIQSKAGNLSPLPAGLAVYDIEGAERNPDAVARMMDMQVVVTEKIEGMNFSVTYVAAEDKIYVNQRKHTITPIEGVTHFFWQLARSHFLVPWDYHVFTNDTEPGPSEYWTDSLLGWLSEIYPGCDITIYGEAHGPKIQGNIYQLPSPELKLYDILVNGEFLDALTFFGLMATFGAYEPFTQKENPHVVPVIFVGTLRTYLQSRGAHGGRLVNETIVEASRGISRLNPEVYREGIVIRPLIERRHPTIGRLIIKQRDPVYLANE